MDGGHYDEALRYNDLAAAQARLSQDRSLVAQTLAFQALLWMIGPLPAEEGIKAIEPLLAEVESSGLARSFVLYSIAELHALTGRYEEARAAAALSRSIAVELGRPLDAASTSLVTGPMERLAGNPEMAEAELRTDYETLERAGEEGWRSTIGSILAHVLCDRGAMDEALALCDEVVRISDEHDTFTQVLCRSARARALAGRDPRAALTLAKDAVARATATEYPILLGNALMCLAQVLEAATQWDEGLGAVQEAITVFQAKGAAAYVHWGEQQREAFLVKRNTGKIESVPTESA